MRDHAQYVEFRKFIKMTVSILCFAYMKKFADFSGHKDFDVRDNFSKYIGVIMEIARIF